ncbi:MAG: SOS response-associated peptidase [Alphaproteobacteria bacterium]|nr:SOS response-associated peptidase [Alphaproteobacteria bacterium]
MCGRFGLFHTWEDMHAAYGLLNQPLNVMPRWNIAPTQAVTAVIRAAAGPNAGGREATGFQWGLIPPWAKDPAIGAKMINARAETLTEKPSFRNAFRRRRCLVPASGFYEWQATGSGPKQPVWISRPDGGLITFAGLWEVWHAPDGGELQTCTIVTTGANETLTPYHHRMPVVLAPDGFDAWLGDGGESAEDQARAAALLRPAPEDALTVRPVGRAVNNIRNDGPELLDAAEPLPAAPKQGELF